MLLTRARGMCGLAKCEICKPEPGGWPGPGPGWRQVRLQCRGRIWREKVVSGVAGSMYRAAAGYRDTPTPSPLRDCFAESLEIGNCSTFAARCGGVQCAGHSASYHSHSHQPSGAERSCTCLRLFARVQAEHICIFMMN